MAKAAQITIGQKLFIEVTSDPSSGGLAAGIGSMAVANLLGVGYVWIKIGPLDTDWSAISAGAVDFSPYVRKDGTVLMTGALQMNTHKITGVIDPTDPQDAATKNYVDLSMMGLKPKAPVRAASAGASINIASALVNGFVLDGVTLATGNRVLLKDQTLPEQNGIYIVVASGAAPRAQDMDSITPIDEINGAWVPVQEGSQAGEVFVQYGVVVTVGVSPITFTFYNPLASAWKFVSAASAMNIATSASYFGTFSGNFDVMFYRNNVKHFAMESSVFGLYVNTASFLSGAASFIRNDSANLSIISSANLIESGNNLQSTAVVQYALTAPNIFTTVTDSVVGGSVYTNMVTKAVAVADGDATADIVYASQGTNKIRKIKLEIFLKSTEGVSCTWEKMVHIDQANAQVLVQDSFTSQNALGASVAIVVTFGAGNLTISASALTGMTGKTYKALITEVINS